MATLRERERERERAENDILHRKFGLFSGSLTMSLQVLNLSYNNEIEEKYEDEVREENEMERQS